MPATLAALGVGSNLGNRLVNLRAALRHLKATAGLKIIQASDVFETPPWGVTDQPYFLNGCVLAECALQPEELLKLLKGIEGKMGRRTTRRWGERVIDLDILAMDSLIYDSPDLHIPHGHAPAGFRADPSGANSPTLGASDHRPHGRRHGVGFS